MDEPKDVIVSWMTWDDMTPLQIYVAQMLVHTRADAESFLILSTGDVYMQFAGGLHDEELHCEAASDEFLPEAMAFSGEQERALLALGFEPPGPVDGGTTPNFHRRHNVTSEGSMRDLATLVRMVLLGIYRCSSQLPVKLELHMNAWRRDATAVAGA